VTAVTTVRDRDAATGAGMAPAPRTAPPSATLLRGVWRENPVLVQMLGLCPALAVTNTVANSLAMGLATFFVLVCSSFLVSSLRRFIPHQVRISTYILIIATFVTIADMLLEATVPEIHRALGAYIALIVCNCVILGRQEAFASRHPVGRAVLDAAGTGAGFIVALLMMGTAREVLGSGSVLGFSLFGPSFEPWIVMILPPGGFLMIGFLLLGMSWWARRRAGGRAASAKAAARAAAGLPSRERPREREGVAG
jgi:Na+-translocating ferredoxin:NAD+ oxidoreductase subunit E